MVSSWTTLGFFPAWQLDSKDECIEQNQRLLNSQRQKVEWWLPGAREGGQSGVSV